jgi:hypothetical protein
MFGGSLPAAWMGAALVLQGLEGFEERFDAALRQGRALVEALDRVPGLSVAPLEDGSNIFPLRLEGGLTAAALGRALRHRGIVLPSEGGTERLVPLAVNTTILRRSNAALLDAFAAAAQAA